MDLKGFGRFSQQVLVPGPGLNLVYGPNESGKSTLMAFVHAMFFGLRGGRRGRQGELSALRRYEPWSGGAYQGILWYELANGDAFRVGRNFARGTVHLQDAHHNDISSRFALDRESGPLFAQAQLGLDGDAFLHSVMVRQARTVLDPAARRNLMDSLIRMRELGQEVTGFRQAETALKQALLERVGSARSTVRPLDRILERLETLAREAEALRRQREESKSLSRRMVEQTERVAALAARQAALQQERAICRDTLAAAELARQRGRERIARERVRTLDLRLKALEQEARMLTGRIAANRQGGAVDAATLARLPFDLERLLELQLPEASATGSDLPETPLGNDFLSEVPLPVEPGDRKRQRARRLRLASSIAVAVGGMALLPAGLAAQWAGVGGVGDTGRLALVIGGGLLVLAGVIGLLLSAGRGSLPTDETPKTGQPAGTAMSQPPARVRPAEDTVEAARVRSRLEARVLAVFAQAGIPETGTLQDRLEWLQSAAAQLQADRARLAENGMRSETLRSERESLARMLPPDAVRPEAAEEVPPNAAEGVSPDVAEGLPPDASEAVTPHTAPPAVEPDASGAGTDGLDEVEAGQRLPLLQEELDMVSEQLSEARMTLASLETRLERMPREDRLQQIVEEMDRLTARRDALASYGEALGVALEELRAAAGQLQQGVSPRLDGLAGGILSDITNGRYTRLGTDDQLAVHVEVPETPEAPVVAALSGGTSDQVWLSVRLAAAQMLEPEKEPLPLFLDEPFAQYDQTRTRAALQWLRTVAQSRQVFLLTCRESDRQLVAEVFGSDGYQPLHLDEVSEMTVPREP